MKKKLKKMAAVFLACGLSLTCAAAVQAEEADGTVPVPEIREETEAAEASEAAEVSEAPSGTEASQPETETEAAPSAESAEPQPAAAEQTEETAEAIQEEAGFSETTEPLLEGMPGRSLDPAEEAVQEEIPVYEAALPCLKEEWEVLRLTNKERMKNGLQPVSTYPALQNACNIRKRELTIKMDHERPDGTACFTVFGEAKVVCNTAGENIAGGQRSPAEVVAGWMNSPGHRRNILDGEFTHMGAGYVWENSSQFITNWVQLFAGTCSPSRITVQNASGAVKMVPGGSVDDLGLILEVTCPHGTGYLPVMDEMCSYDAAGGNKVQTVEVSYQGAKTSFQADFGAAVAYQTHVQSIGWQGLCYNGDMSGTEGQSKRLEAIRISLAGQDAGGDIEYRTHVQSKGWETDWVKNGKESGTVGISKRLEAIQIRLTGEMAQKYDIYYQVHAQSYGWLGWAKNGEPSGTAGYGKRLEGIRIVLKKKGEAAPGSTAGAYQCPLIQYSTHVQTYGWQGNMSDGAVSGTEGQSKRLEGIRIFLTNQQYAGNVEYQTHVQSFGWEAGWTRNGEVSGTTGLAKRLEAIRIRLTDEMERHYDIYYQVHAQSYGWLGWAKNGEPAGTAGYGKRLEGIRICLVPKGGSAPGSPANAYVSKNGV